MSEGEASQRHLNVTTASAAHKTLGLAVDLHEREGKSGEQNIPSRPHVSRAKNTFEPN